MQRSSPSAVLSTDSTITNLRIFLINLPVFCVGVKTGRRLRVFEKRVLRRIFGPRRDEVTGEWRKLYEELNELYSSSNIVRVIKSRRMRWAGHVARNGDRSGVFRIKAMIQKIVFTRNWSRFLIIFLGII